MIPLLFGLFFGIALYRAYRLDSKRWFFALLPTLIIGLINLGVNVIMALKTDCGDSFDPDTGCSSLVPEWTITLGLAMLALAFLFSFIIFVLDVRNLRKPEEPKKKKKN